MWKRRDAGEGTFELVVMRLGLGGAEMADTLDVDLDDIDFGLEREPMRDRPMAW